MNADPDTLFPLQLSLIVREREKHVLIEGPADLRRALAEDGVRSLEIRNLAPQSVTHLEILSRDLLARDLIEAHLGPARNSYLTPVGGQMHLWMEF